MARDILSYFPSHLTPRQLQIDVLKEIEAGWSTNQVFVLNVPVAGGKSAISATIAAWCKDAAIITPNNILRDQYATEYPELFAIRSTKEFWCEHAGMNVRKRKQKFKGELCKDFMKCPGCNEYREVVEEYKRAPALMGNYYGYMSAGLHFDALKKTLIVDEAHGLWNLFRDLAAKRIWQHKAHFPPNMNSRLQMASWAESIPGFKLMKDGLLQLFKKQILSSEPNYTFEMAREPYGKALEMKQVLKMIPVEIEGLDEVNQLWPRETRHIVLMSATISKEDIKAFGLDKRRIKYIEADSPIPSGQRPIIIPADRVNMAYGAQEKNLPKFIKFIKELAEARPNEKGLVHLPYNLVSKVKAAFSGDDRFVFHERDNKTDIYNLFRNSDKPIVLFGSGMNEGIDLPGDLCRWQVIGKVPYPSLADPALRYIANKDRKFYAWTTIKDMIQASGRVCRTPEDWGETYVFDSCFVRLYEENQELFPNWFKQAVVTE